MAVQHTIGLRAGRSHCGALARIEDAKLDARLVGRNRHRTTERIDFLDQVALADAANRRIAAHRTQRLDVVRNQQGLHTHARCRQGGFGAGVTAAYDDHVKLIRMGKGFRRHGEPREGRAL